MQNVLIRIEIAFGDAMDELTWVIFQPWPDDINSGVHRFLLTSLLTTYQRCEQPACVMWHPGHGHTTISSAEAKPSRQNGQESHPAAARRAALASVSVRRGSACTTASLAAPPFGGALSPGSCRCRRMRGRSPPCLAARA